MCTNISEQIEWIRTEHEKLKLKKEEQDEKEFKKAAKQLSRRADETIYKIYDALRKEVYASCGIGPVVKLFVDYHGLNSDNGKELQALIESRIGLKVSPIEGTYEYLNIDLSTEAKTYAVQIKTADTSSEEVSLDFPKILEENRSRCKLWHEFVPKLADDIIKKCVEHLEKMPSRFYGILPMTTIVNERGNIPFTETFDFYGVQCKYGVLTEEQFKELELALDARVNHGMVTISRDTILSRMIRVYFCRTPEVEKEGASFDYAEYYNKYNNTVYPQLQEVFDAVAEGVHFSDFNNQIKTLQPRRILEYRFNSAGKMKFDDMRKYLENGPHHQSLIDFLNEKLYGIRITEFEFQNREESWCSPRGCARGTNSYDERIEFGYDIIDEKCEFVQEQIETEDIIQRIADEHYTDIATMLLKVILDDINSVGLKKLFNNGYPTTEIKRTTCVFKLDEEPYVIDLREVNNEAFRANLEAEVNRQTDQLISISMGSIMSYKINL